MSEGSGALAKLFALDGRVALITGASSGLGCHFAEFLALSGARVVLAARRVDRLEEIATRIREKGGEVFVAALDVGDDAVIASTVEWIEREFAPIDILVNNAGIAMPSHALKTTSSDWDMVMGVNLRGVFFVAQAVAAGMRKRGGGGSIVNIASLTATRPFVGLAAYAAAKAGVVQLTRVLALEWARFGIRVNAIAPGYVVTEMNAAYLGSAAGERLRQVIPQQRFGVPQDLDGVLALLVSDGGKWITGTMIHVDGGHELAG